MLPFIRLGDIIITWPMFISRKNDSAQFPILPQGERIKHL